MSQGLIWRHESLTEAEHTFIIRNGANAPLQLKNGGTTCKCTVAELPERLIAPGEGGTVRLAWHTGLDREYAHGATIETNDPDHSRLYLRVQGDVQVICAASADEILFPPQDSRTSAHTLITIQSSVWTKLEIPTGRSTIDGLVWKATAQ